MLDTRPAWALQLAAGAKENGSEVAMGYTTPLERTHTSLVSHGENGHSKIRSPVPTLRASALRIYESDGQNESQVPPHGKSYRGSIIPFLNPFLDHRELKPPINQELHEREIPGQ